MYDKIQLRHQLSFYGVPFALGILDRTVFGAVTFPSCSSVVSLITRSHEACTDANQCSPGALMAFSSRPSVPLLITSAHISHIRSRCHSQIAFPTVLMFFLVTQVRNCEDESCILNDLHRITREREVLVRSIKGMPWASQEANENLHSPLKADIV
ncbi:hypothetical protein T12_16514 [Trichinella patagoniensis]|uniref:Uncharacterized protein n=1 Tax=Trichinella patagoniensis TaxID=990121 RepID=A0A0V1A0M0_9BILA|nr:hypothetical protein T12_16514 [Trichinella patagoniensis]